MSPSATKGGKKKTKGQPSPGKELVTPQKREVGGDGDAEHAAEAVSDPELVARMSALEITLQRVLESIDRMQDDTKDVKQETVPHIHTKERKCKPIVTFRPGEGIDIGVWLDEYEQAMQNVSDRERVALL